MREMFRALNFRASTRAIIDQANAICADYRAQGYDLTLRQVYYQFVARGLLGNSDRNYKRLGSIINDARLAGEMDWSYIQDRGRNVRGSFGGYVDPGQYIDSVADGYVEALWRSQDYRPEVWVEKEALADIVGQAANAYRVPYFACKGYVSQSEMYSAAKRFQTRRRQGHIPVVIHLGDHDPSGIDMTRDIQDRLAEMSLGYVEVRRIALNMDQIEQYDPPPNPAKLTDSRGTAYVEEYGDSSWELDALEPSVLTSLIQDEIQTMLDFDAWDAAQEAERANEDRIRLIADRWADLDENWDAVLDVIGR